MSSLTERKGSGALHRAMVFGGSLIAGIMVLVVFLHFVGIQEVMSTIRSVDPRLMALAFCLDIVGLFLYGAAWYVLVRGSGLKIRFPTAISVSLAGIFLCYITPSGVFMDASRILLASRESDIRVGDGAATVLVHKILFTLGFVTYALVAVTMLFVTSGVPHPFFSSILVISLLVIIGITGLVLIIMKADQLARSSIPFLERPKRFLARLTIKYQRSVSAVGGIAGDFRGTFVRLTKAPHVLLVSYSLSLLYWASSVLIMYLVFLGLGYGVSVWVIMLAITVGDFIQMMPIAVPGMVGILEVAMTSVLVMFGVPLSVAVSATLLARVATFWFDLPITGAAASYYGTRYLKELVSCLR